MTNKNFNMDTAKQVYEVADESNRMLFHRNTQKNGTPETYARATASFKEDIGKMFELCGGNAGWHLASLEDSGAFQSLDEVTQSLASNPTLDTLDRQKLLTKVAEGVMRFSRDSYISRVERNDVQLTKAERRTMQYNANMQEIKFARLNMKGE